MIKKKIISILLISLMCTCLIACKNSNKSNNSESNKSSITVKNAKSNESEELKLVLNTELTSLLVNNLKPDENIVKTIVSQKNKKEDSLQKDIYIYFFVNNIDNINTEEIAKSSLNILQNNPKTSTDFWGSHNGTIVFRNPEIDDEKNIKIYKKYSTKEGTNELISVHP